MSFTTLSRAANNSSTISDIFAGIAKKNAKFTEKNGSDSDLSARIAAFGACASQARGLVAAIYEDLGHTPPSSGVRTPVKFVDGSVLVYKGETVASWVGNKAIDSDGHDIEMDRYDHSIRVATRAEVNHFLYHFITLATNPPKTRRILRFASKLI
jgi:hypothetical protein